MASREDDFPLAIKQLLSQRVGLHCSRPECDRPTSGPRLDDHGATNVGVAAHITAASPEGPRYDPALTSEQRKSADNGIWLCSSCATLIDSDRKRYTVDALRAWKSRAEAQATARLVAPSAPPDRSPFLEIETLMPELLAEMTADLQRDPLAREIVLLGKRWQYVGPQLRYYYESHSRLDDLMRILVNHGLVHDTSRNKLTYYVLSEALVAYLQSRAT